MRSMGRPDGARPGGMRVAATSCLRQLQEKLRQLLIAGSHALAMVPDCRVGRPGPKAHRRPMRPLLGPRGTQLTSVLSMGRPDGAHPGGM